MARGTVALMSLLAGLALAGLVLLTARRGRLSMRYTLGWFFVAVCIVVGGVLSSLIDPVAEFLDVSGTALVIATASAGLLGLTLQLSITVSGLTERTRTLAESVAILEAQLAETRRSQDDADPDHVAPPGVDLPE